jgi:hypothetical protein
VCKRREEEKEFQEQEKKPICNARYKKEEELIRRKRNQ